VLHNLRLTIKVFSQSTKYKEKGISPLLPQTKQSGDVSRKTPSFFVFYIVKGFFVSDGLATEEVEIKIGDGNYEKRRTYTG